MVTPAVKKCKFRIFTEYVKVLEKNVSRFLHVHFGRIFLQNWHEKISGKNNNLNEPFSEVNKIRLTVLVKECGSRSCLLTVCFQGNKENSCPGM